MVEKKHLYYFDYLRFFAMLCVVFMHCAVAGLRIPSDEIDTGWHITNILTSLSFSAVPLFFMISGYLLISSERTADVSYLFKKRIPKLVVPLIVYSALATLHVLNAQGKLGFSAFFSLFATAATNPVMVHFWFMYTLVGMYLISPFLYRGLSSLDDGGRKYLAILTVTVVFFVTAHAVLPVQVQQYVPYKVFSELLFFGGHISAFVLGWLLGSMKRKIPNFVLLLVAAADLFVIVFMTYKMTVARQTYTQIFQSQKLGFEILLAACIFVFAKQTLNRPSKLASLLILPLTALSFPVYLLHNVFLGVLNLVLGNTLYPTSPQGICLLTLFTVVFCFVALKTLATIKPLCYAFTGMSYKAACESCNWVYTAKRLLRRSK